MVSNDLLPSSFPSWISYAFLISESCYTTRQLFLDLCPSIWRREQVVKLHSMQMSHFSRYLPTHSCKIAVPWLTLFVTAVSLGGPGSFWCFPYRYRTAYSVILTDSSHPHLNSLLFKKNPYFCFMAFYHIFLRSVARCPFTFSWNKNL
jgi:hypothetical protein